MCIFEIFGSDPGDTLGPYLLPVSLLMRDHRYKDRDLSACIISLDISLGIALRIALLLRFLKNSVEISTFTFHLGKDIICSSVKYTLDALDPFGRKCIIKSADDRNTAAYAGFKEIINIILFCDLHKLITLCSNKLLIGSADTLAGFHSSLGKSKSRLYATHRFAYDLHFIICENGLDIMNNKLFKGITRKISEVENVFNMHIYAMRSYDIRILLNHFNYSASYRSVSEDCCLNHIIILLSFKFSLNRLSAKKQQTMLEILSHTKRARKNNISQ